MQNVVFPFYHVCHNFDNLKLRSPARGGRLDETLLAMAEELNDFWVCNSRRIRKKKQDAEDNLMQ